MCSLLSAYLLLVASLHVYNACNCKAVATQSVMYLVHVQGMATNAGDVKINVEDTDRQPDTDSLRYMFLINY